MKALNPEGAPLTNLQLELVKLFAQEVPEEDLRLCLELAPIANQGLMNPAEMRGRLWRHLF